MSGKKKQEIVTFKVDQSMFDALRGIENRSEFIRLAILSALDNNCPLCKGTGILTPDQREHWKKFTRQHSVEVCDDCHALYIVCNAVEAASGN